MFRLLAACGVVVAACGPALANPAMTTGPVEMRESPSSRARVVQSVPPHAQIDISECRKSWRSASWRDIDGFVPARAVSTADVGPLVEAGGPPPPPPVVVAPFGWGYGYYGWHRHYY
jgi:hypothetical protein